VKTEEKTPSMRKLPKLLQIS